MRTSRVVIVLSALVLVAAGCGDDDSDGATGAGDTDQTTPTATATVAIADSELGEILVDGEGMTLYLFTNDEGDTSTCTGDCAEAWPPLEAPDELVAGEGVDESLLGTTERDDGSVQVTYASAPLYYYAPDSAPGDTTGQGVGGVWFVVGADGEAIQEAAAPSGSGY